MAGCDVVGASNGREGLHILHGGLRPCMVLLDVRMPQMDGWTMWQRVQAHAELARTSVGMEW